MYIYMYIYIDIYRYRYIYIFVCVTVCMLWYCPIVDRYIYISQQVHAIVCNSTN